MATPEEKIKEEKETVKKELSSGFADGQTKKMSQADWEQEIEARTQMKKASK